MSAQLNLVAKRQATWSQAANVLKKRIDTVRWLVFALAIIGALLAAIASQTPNTSDALMNLHGFLTAIGTVLLAAGTFVSARLLKETEIQGWVRMRAASEALKREAYKYAAGARPYDDAQADQNLDRARANIEKDLDDLSDRTATSDSASSLPVDKITKEQYRDTRVMSQVTKFYKPRAEHYRKIASRWRACEFVLALAATIVTALAGVFPKVWIVAGFRFDLAALTAVLTTISGAILAHIEAARYQYLVTSYLATARRLEDASVDFDASADPQKWSDYVNRCEDILAAENSSWVAGWTKSRNP
jgi:hypothetical protein